jgi:hypothetical protein
MDIDFIKLHRRTQSMYGSWSPPFTDENGVTELID